MKISIPFDFSGNLRDFLRRAGYAEFNDPNTGKSSYTKRLARDYYPRFHLYIEEGKDRKKFFNLHLDQKRPSYPGAHAHSGEYEGEIITQESKRLEGLIKNQINNQKQSQRDKTERGFWTKLFK